MKINIRLLCICLLLFQIFNVTRGRAQTAIHFNGKNIVIGQQIAILEDPGNQLSFDAVKKSSKFILSQTAVPNLQLTNSSFWLRFVVKNKSGANQLMLNLEYPTLDICNFYYPKNGVYHNENLSDKNAFNKRKYKHQDFVFDMPVPPDSTAVFYLKVHSNEEMVLPLILGTPQKIAESKLIKDLLWGLLIGILLVMILYNTFVFISTGDISYLYYVCYTLFICLTQTSLSGYTYRFIFPNHPALFNLGIILFPALAGISLLLFAESFLGVKKRMPKMSLVFKLIILLYSAAILLRFAGFDLASYRMIDICALCLTLSVYIVVIALSINGYRPARFFLLGWTLFLLGIILFVLRNLGVLPYNDLTNYTMQVGTALEVTLLSLALADRINIFKADKEKSQAETVKVLQENERIIREQNIVLEDKVEERTAEIIATNHELNKTLDDLKQAQTQLVESEKMASLGQLTAGIAHEINNPINFVTSNVKPLKRNVELLMDALGKIEEIGYADISVADKQQQIRNYKEELEYDYLTLEITHLIKGINEGAKRTAEIVKGLKIFSRLDEDELKLADLNEGIESTIIIANHLLSGIQVNKTLGALPEIQCFAGKLNQVFLNLLSNSAYAIKKRFGEKTGGIITITTASDEQVVIIRFRDNGTGMDQDTQKKIFEPFFTTKDVGEGTGLGMSIVYNTIKKHNGTVLIYSEPNQGTEIEIRIPKKNNLMKT